MLKNYEINTETLMLIPLDEKTTKIIEISTELIVECNILKIIDNSCRFFGSSFNGRCDGAKSLIGMSYKLPIIIEESKEIVFFPTCSPKQPDCIWISLLNLELYQKNQKTSQIGFKNNQIISLDISYGSLENQIFRATMLLMTLKKRKKIG